MQVNSLLQAALDYEQRGFSVIPVNPENKKPFIKWAEYQNRKASPSEVQAWWSKWPGAMLGIVTGPISGIFVIDCDTQEGYEAIQKLIPEALLFPLARTPRGGWHLWFKWLQEYKLTVAAGIMPGVDFRGKLGYIIAPPSKNAKGKSYSWEKGLSLDDVEIPSMPDALSRALHIYKDNLQYRGGVDTVDNGENYLTAGRRDQDLFSVANALVKNNLPEKLTKQVIEIIASNCKPPFPSEEANSKIQSAIDRAKRRDGTLSTEVREWVLSTTGNFLSTDIHNGLHLSTREDKKNVSIILKRLSIEGIIEKYGNKNGQFRCLDSEIETLDWLHADVTPLDLKWPFEIEKLVSLYPGNIAVIAGSPNAGKTSLILNFIHLNQKTHKIHLFSSEGGKEELKQRLSKFDFPLNAWSFSAWERTRDFQDVIKPDAINIIDYLEIHDEFYKIGGIIKEISDRLKNGFCLIALQKNSGRDEGLGGARGLEKPRLYMAMDGGKLKIVKGKSWANKEKNPNGQVINFKLIDGCRFKQESSWQRES